MLTGPSGETETCYVIPHASPQAKRAAVCLLCWLLLCSGLGAQRTRRDQQNSAPALQHAAQDAATKYHIPGVAVALLDHGTVSAIGVSGFANLQSRSPITPNTIFEAGALGEPLFAYAVLQLAADGRLDLGAPITRYLPLPYSRDLDALAPSSGTEPIYDPRLDQVSALRLLNHTAGFPDWARNEHLRLRSTPGQQWSYSDEGLVYLQHAVERVTNQPASEFLLDSILTPVGMAHSSFVWREGYAGQAAQGYDRAGAPVQPDEFMRPAPGATLYTTIEDYARFVAVLMASAPALRTHEATVSLMLEPSVTVDAATSFSWGLGCGIENSGDDVFFFHRGIGRGYASFFIASRTKGLGVVILTNSARGLDAVPDLVSATIGGSHPALKSPFLRSF